MTPPTPRPDAAADQPARPRLPVFRGRLAPIAILLAAGLALRLLIAYVLFPGEGLGSDLHLFGVWAQTLVDHGPGGFYENAGFADYPPGYLWILWPLGLVGNALAGVTGQAPADVISSLIKLPAIIADLLVALLLYWSVSRWQSKRAGLIAAALFLFLPVTWYDSALWGQVDSIGALLLLGSMVFLVEGWSEAAVALGVYATVTKPQYAIGLAIIGAVLLRRHLFRRGTGPVPRLPSLLAALDGRLNGLLTVQQGFRRLLSCSIVGLAVGVLTILPFDLPSQAPSELASIPIVGSVAGLLSVIGSAASFYSVLTVNAFNFWAFVGPLPLTGAVGGNLVWQYDSLPIIAGIPAVTLGALGLGAIALAVIATLLVRDDRNAIILGFAVLAFAFFAVPTRVHERYLFPVFAIGAVLAVSSLRWRWWLVLVAFANVANLHAILTLPIPGYGTPAIVALPLGSELRDPFVVGLIADAQTGLFLILLFAFAKEIVWPILRDARRASWRNLLPAAAVPSVLINDDRQPPSASSRATGLPASLSRRTPSKSARTSQPESDLVLLDRPERAGIWGVSALRPLDDAIGRLTAWLRGRSAAVVGRIPRPVKAASPAGEDQSAELGSEGPGRLDRRDLLIFLVVLGITFGTRVVRLDTPLTMYFDERWHATTATEFLQDWEYGIPHTISEWTHPHVAKYLMAAGIVAFGDNKVTDEGLVGASVRDAALEASYLDPTAPGGIGGDVLLLASSDGLRVALHGSVQSAKLIRSAGERAVTFDQVAHVAYVAFDNGDISAISSADLQNFALTGAPPRARPIVSSLGAITHLWALGGGALAAQTASDSLIILNTASGAVLATEPLPGMVGVVPIMAGGKPLILVGLPDRLVELAATTLQQVASVQVANGVKGMDLVDGSDELRRERDLLEQPILYVATGGARMKTFTVDPNGVVAPLDDFPMPGPVTTVEWNRATNLVHVVGTAPDGSATIYVVEPHADSVFADAHLPFTPTTVLLDVQPDDPASDREQALAFGPSSQFATVDVGSNAFSFRLPGVILGALTAALLYLLARLLFRRRSVAVITAVLITLDGLMFQQSRIAMNDVYVGFFIVAAFTLLAYLLQRRSVWRRARLELLLGPPLLGLIFGLALASKWVGLYAMGGAALIVLLRSVIGRRLALVGMVGIGGTLGYLAVADDPPNVAFVILIVVLCVLLGIGIVRDQIRGPADGESPGTAPDGPSWLNPRSWHGVPFVWFLGCLLIMPIVVYVAIYIPWALSTAGGPQLFPGWPPGHTGQTFLDLQAQMYQYHDDFRFPHGAGSPWWAWPFGLKPIWGYLATFVDGSQASILGTANPLLLWLSVPAIGFGAWQAWRRRSAALAFVVLVFLALWLPWARIDRVTFNYHYYAALPFAFLLLGYFLAELWHGTSARIWLLARVSVVVTLFLPTALWVFKGPLCVIAGVDQAAPDAAVCSSSLDSFAAPVAVWTVGALILSFIVLRGRRPRRLVIGLLIGAGLVFAVEYPILSAMQLPNGWPWIYQGLLPSWDSTFQFVSNQLPATAIPIVGFGAAIALALVAALVLVTMRMAQWWDVPASTRASR